MDGAFLLLVLGIFCCGFLLVVFCCGSWGGAQSALDWVMGTLGMLGSKFFHIVKVMGILVAGKGLLDVVVWTFLSRIGVWSDWYWFCCELPLTVVGH
jgi:hypothetical protein